MAIIQALDFIGAVDLYPHEMFEKKQRYNRESCGIAKRTPDSASACTFTRRKSLPLRVEDLDALLDQDRGFFVSEIAAQPRDYLEHIRSVLPGAIDRAFEACRSGGICGRLG